MPAISHKTRLLLRGREDAKNLFQELLNGASESCPPCSNDPELWWSNDVLDQRRAQNFCFECPLLETCYRYAVQGSEEWGIWGGTTSMERSRHIGQLRREQLRAAKQ